MADIYTQVVNTPPGRFVTKQVGLPAPVELKRHRPGQAPLDGPVLLGGAPHGRLGDSLARVLADAGLETVAESEWAGSPTPALVFDATGVADPDALSELHAFFSPNIRSLKRCGRVVVLGTPPSDARTPSETIVQRALEGFTRSVGKEVRHGATAQLVYVAEGGEEQIASTLRFLLSPRSAYVSGQVIHIDPAAAAPAVDWERPLKDQIALVTGASRGIGAAIAQVMARDGAHVVGLDIPALSDDLRALTGRLGGSAIEADITAPDAPQKIAEHLRANYGGVDAVVHNAGITRDKTLGRMDEEVWSSVIDVNLRAAQRITDELMPGPSGAVLRPGARVVCVSSISGIAGNAGQTNYATSKAGVIGLVDAYAPLLGADGMTINAVAPGFIETQMTARMPFAVREVGRRMNSLSQGGLPVDVAEAVAWMANPASLGVNGNVVRVCGQSLLGA